MAATPLAAALHEAMRERGLRVADLARELGVKEPTVRAAADGRVEVPHWPLREALDAYFGAPSGTTLDICERRVKAYPSEAERRLVALVQALPAELRHPLMAFLEALVA